MKNGVKYYLAVYNLLAFCAWAAYLVAYARFFITHRGDKVLLLLDIAQGLALLEILHVAVKWVRSPLGTTLAQVSSRIVILVLLNIMARTGCSLTVITAAHLLFCGWLLISIAWSATELVRYSFYFLNLLGTPPPFLLWMRYSFFIVLYPLGVTGEWLIIAAPVANNHVAFNAYLVFAVGLAAVYIFYFPKLYGYMWMQRKERLGVAG